MADRSASEETLASASVTPAMADGRVDALGLIGRVIEDRYEVEELIGAGAMGYVYRGRQLRLRRAVAIKVPKPEISKNRDFMARFEREALTMARCVHENIAAIYDVSVPKEPGQLNYIAMELVQGAELDHFLRAEESNLTVRAVVDIFRQIARGLDAAHQAGIIHRDIKPSNLIVTMPQRVAKIMDFGIAKGDVENAYETQATQALGTPAFMSPEQIRGDGIGAATDIYAFGMTLYKLLARDLPFRMTSAHSLLFAHLDTVPLHLSERNPLWPEALGNAIGRAIEKTPDKRHATASKLIDEVEAALLPVMGEPFASFFPQNAPPQKLVGSRTAALPRMTSKKPKEKQTAIYAVGGIILVVAVLFALTRGGGDDPGGRGGNNVAVAPGPTRTPAPTPSPSPVPTVRPTPSPSPSPSPSPTPSPSPSPTPRPSPTVVVVTTPSPVPTPFPTPSPRPRATPTPGPSPSPTPSRPIYAWGPEIFGSQRQEAINSIEEVVVDGLRREIFRGRFDEAAKLLSGLEAPERDRFIQGLERLGQGFGNMRLLYTPNTVVSDGYRIDGKRAMVSVNLGLTGKDKTNEMEGPDRDLTDRFDANIVLEKRGDQWVVVEWPSDRFFP
ncbi:MAG: serine/threonine-protein kinase [Candidatus Sumerlaeia bacterium]|nr:serine/threonine-protein kinase [Candidatus Sumerlaeia bacterium]